MKLKALLTLALLCALPLQADQTPAEAAVHWFNVYAETGGSMADYVNDEGFTAYAEALVASLEDTPRDLHPHENNNISRYAWFAEGLEDSRRAEISRLSGLYNFPAFVRHHITEQELRDHIIDGDEKTVGMLTNVWFAAGRLGNQELLWDMFNTMTGTGIIGDNRYTTMFNQKVAELSKQDTVEALRAASDLIWKEIVGLEALPETEARNARIFQLRGSIAMRTERIKQLQSLAE